MTDLRKAAEMLMKALDDGWVERGDNVAIALRQALAQDEQSCCCGKPTALGVVHRKDNPCYIAQPEQNSEAYGYAKRLAEAIWEKHYKKESPHWRPFHDVLGVLTQIDNMTCGLEKAQFEQEPVAWVSEQVLDKQFMPDGSNRRVWWEMSKGVGIPLYAAPQSKPLIALTDEEISAIDWKPNETLHDYARAIEAKLGEKNT